MIKLEVANVGLKGEKVRRDKPLGARARQQQNKLTYGEAYGNRAQATRELLPLSHPCVLNLFSRRNQLKECYIKHPTVAKGLFSFTP